MLPFSDELVEAGRAHAAAVEQDQALDVLTPLRLHLPEYSTMPHNWVSRQATLLAPSKHLRSHQLFEHAHGWPAPARWPRRLAGTDRNGPQARAKRLRRQDCQSKLVMA